MAASDNLRARLRALARAPKRGNEDGVPSPRPEAPRVTLADVWPSAREAGGFWLATPPWPAGYPRPDAAALERVPAATAVDVESLGRTPKPLILVGMASVAADGVTFTQFIATHPDEEEAVLRQTLAAARAAPLLISYNGSSFDLPVLRTRLTYWRLAAGALPPHVDLLPLVRRRYKKELGMPGCGLGDAERWLAGLARPDDIPSARVPELYVRALQAGDPRPLVPILKHNLYDLAGTALVYLRAATEHPAAFAPQAPPAANEDAALF